MKTRIAVTIVVLAANLTAIEASAQFTGDVIFKQPSVSVAENGVAEVEVEAFSGALPLGAVHFDVNFDPAKLDVVSVLPGAADELNAGFSSKVTEGRVGVVALNTQDLSGPIGTVSLAKIALKPKVAAPARVNLVITARSILDTGTRPFPSIRGFGGEVNVVSAANPLSARGAATAAVTKATADAALTTRAEALRRPGAKVNLVVVELKDGSYVGKTLEVQTVEPSAPKDIP